MAEDELPRNDDSRRREPRSVAASGGSDYNMGIAVFSYVVGGILVWSLIGWGLDNLLGTRWIVLAGALLGAGGGFYLAFAQRQARTRTPPSGGKGRPDGRNRR